MIRLAHLSDLHATPVGIGRPLVLANKRFWGWLSWIVRRRHVYQARVLEALIEDLHTQAPDHVAITGDLTNIALPGEFPAARCWLERIGSPERVSVVPGNHDAYVRVDPSTSWDLWNDWMRSDEAVEPRPVFPTLRVRDGLALVGACSAEPTWPFLASGSLGAPQLERLEKTLASLADSPLCRVLLVHHPVIEGTVSWRRALRDARALRQVLARTGVDLVLHGHAHRTVVGEIAGPDGPIPVRGVRSSSNLGDKPQKRSQYHIYEIEPVPSSETNPDAKEDVDVDGARFRITTRTRGYDPARGRFIAE